MKIATKELRLHPGRVIGYAVNGHEITITYRGKALAKIVPLHNSSPDSPKAETSVFGLWKDRAASQTVDDFISNLRKGRRF
jgi:antitoxin (DNA-binding transcriptional repressor) of toxin-antitoxin stability system